MSNSTQKNEIKQIEKAIDEGFAESEKFLKGMKTPFDKPSTQNDFRKIKSFKPLPFGFEKGLISHDGACYIKKDNINFYGQNIDPKELDNKIKTLEKLKLIKEEYELFFGKI